MTRAPGWAGIGIGWHRDRLASGSSGVRARCRHRLGAPATMRSLSLPKIPSGLARMQRWATIRAGMIDLLKLLGGFLVGLFRSQAAREAEMAFLRQQLLVLKRSAPASLRLRNADRLIFVWLYRLFPSLLAATVIFQPETLVRWHRSGFRVYWRWKSRRRVGRPAVPADIRDLIRTMSRDNPLWGAPRIHGELMKLGIDIAQSTVAKYIPDGATPLLRVGGPFCAITPPTSLPLICSSFRRSGSSFSTGWSSCVWSGDGSSGPM